MFEWLEGWTQVQNWRLLAALAFCAGGFWVAGRMRGWIMTNRDLKRLLDDVPDEKVDWAYVRALENHVFDQVSALKEAIEMISRQRQAEQEGGHGRDSDGA